MADSKTNEWVYIDHSPIHGRGLFAAKPISAGQLIGVYQGPIVREDNPHVLWIEDQNGETWTGYNGQNEMRFLNHSDEPNAEMDGLQCFALCDMPPGTEITIDYGWNDS